jgi:hypothetical protein
MYVLALNTEAHRAVVSVLRKTQAVIPKNCNARRVLHTVLANKIGHDRGGYSVRRSCEIDIGILQLDVMCTAIACDNW